MIYTTIDNAIAQQQAAGIDTSALTALKAQLESALSEARQGQTGVVQTSPPVSEPAMADAISTLMNLPTNAQTQAKVEAARRAYFDYLTASPENKVAAYDNTVKQLRESINAVMEMDGLDAGSRAVLEGLLDNIDSSYRTRDNRTVDLRRFNFNRYLRKMFGNPPTDMVNPHAHHILFKEGLGDTQKALVKEGQALLRRYGIDPIWGLENLVWAPNRVAGQHGIEALRYVIDKLKLVEDFGGSYNDIVEALEELGEKAAKRRG